MTVYFLPARADGSASSLCGDGSPAPPFSPLPVARKVEDAALSACFFFLAVAAL
jgi:hypothetical protein